MKAYNVGIEMTAQYLQARFSEKAKAELLKDAKKTIIRPLSEEDVGWLQLSYFDDSGYYVPKDQIKGSIVSAAKDFKMKAKRTSLMFWAKATLFVRDEKNYLDKKEPDTIETSYPKRKDGNRVRIKHPAFNVGTVVNFTVECLDDDFNETTLIFLG